MHVTYIATASGNDAACNYYALFEISFAVNIVGVVSKLQAKFCEVCCMKLL